MPIYKYICQKCDSTFDIKVSLEEKKLHDEQKFKCPNCNSKNIKQDFGGINICKQSTQTDYSHSCDTGCCCGG